MSEPPPLFNGTMSNTPKHLSVAPKKSTPKKNSSSLSQSNGTPSASGSITLASTTKKSKESKLKKKDKERSTSIGIGGSAPGEKLFNGKVEPRESSLAADPFPTLPPKKKSKAERERERERLDRENSEKPLKETSIKPRKDRSPSTLPKIKVPKFEPEPTPPTGALPDDDDDPSASPIPTTTVSTGTGNTNTLADVITHPLLAASLRTYNASHPPSSSSTPPTSLTTFPPTPQSRPEITRALITTGDFERLKTLLTNGLKTTGWYENCAKIARQKIEDGSAKSFEDLWAQMHQIANPDTVDEGVKEEVESAIADWVRANGFDESGGQRKRPKVEKEG